ncbi:MAG: replication factor C large subunit [Candidatus Pacearchaeota archaeon]|jgi:replication factor C large subunit
MSENFENWSEKHRALSFVDLKGQDVAISELKSFFSKFPQDKKAILLHGPAGTGKTSLAHIAKNELDLEIFELNASDFRNKEQLEAKLKPASEQRSLFKKGKVLLVDEVDGLSGSDRGGLPELVSLIENTQFPMIITANNIWDAKFVDLRKKCKVVELKEINYKDISFVLQNIAKKENLTVDNQILISIAVRANGDMRAAINDLQIIASDKDFLRSYIVLDQRNKELDIFSALKFVFKNPICDETLRIYDSVDIPLEKIGLWIEENIPYEYSGEELFNAYEMLSASDIFFGRIQRQRHWRFLIYQNVFLSAGISLSKKKPKLGYTHYQKPSRILKIWMNNSKQIHKKTIVAKYAEAIHCSKYKAVKEFNIIKPFLKNPKIQKELKLSEQEIEYIKAN